MNSASLQTKNKKFYFSKLNKNYKTCKHFKWGKHRFYKPSEHVILKQIGH